ncbi:hypothetical protein NPIL_383531 [Nephila pilipes]|uniref:Uncharacterized protein n=1 Tax=Nephila pilipes TaxID=299642 RepID=A0A8X6PNS9_NEPPI|nr:hypothetical protein NPIL_383531 [Nephila pilipes]
MWHKAHKLCQIFSLIKGTQVKDYWEWSPDNREHLPSSRRSVTACCQGFYRTIRDFPSRWGVYNGKGCFGLHFRSSPEPLLHPQNRYIENALRNENEFLEKSSTLNSCILCEKDSKKTLAKPRKLVLTTKPNLPPAN